MNLDSADFESDNEFIELLDIESKDYSNIKLLYDLNILGMWTSGKYIANREASKFIEDEVYKIFDECAGDGVSDADLSDEEYDKVYECMSEYVNEEPYYLTVETELDWDKLTITAVIGDKYNYTLFVLPKKVINMKLY